MKIAMVISSLTCGGAERAMSSLANSLAGIGWDITILSFESPAGGSFYPLSPRINVRPLDLRAPSANSFGALRNNHLRLRKLRNALREIKANAVISFMHPTNSLVRLSTMGLEVPVIVSERVDPKALAKSERSVGSICWRALRAIAYRGCAAVVVQTKRAADHFSRSARTVLIPNAVVKPCGGPVLPISRPYIIAMGRLVPQKGFDLLITAFRDVSKKHPDWTLVILGDGPERAALGTLIQRQGLDKSVILHGAVPEVGEALKNAGLFVLSSRFEGFPNSLCEAMACGLPVISFDCESGPQDIIRPEVDGLLVPPEDTAALGAAIERLICDPELRRRLAGRAVEIVERYSLRANTDSWKSLIEELAR